MWKKQTIIYYWWECISTDPLEGYLEVSYEMKHIFNIPSTTELWCLLEGTKNMCTQNPACGCYISFTHHCQNLEASKIFFSMWMDNKL